MRSSNIHLSALLALALAATACSDAEAPDDDGGIVPSSICVPARAICAGDTICGDVGCEPAFDRDYEVRLSLSLPGKPLDKCLDGDCPLPTVAVYYSERSSPIIEAGTPQVAEIHVIEGSSLIVDFGDDACEVELSADRLRGGQAGCSRNGVSAHLQLVAQPN